MKKLFISQPMGNRTDEDIDAERAKIKKEVVAEYGEVQVLDSHIKTDMIPTPNALWHLSKALELLSEADMVYFADGWEHARGCRIERTCCRDYNIKVIRE